MFNRNFDRRIFLTMLAIMVGAMIPTILVITTQTCARMIPSVLVGIGLYHIFFRKNQNREE